VIHLGIVGRMIFIKEMICSIEKVDPVMDRKFLEAVPEELVAFENSFTIHMVQLMEKHGKPILGVKLLPDENARTIMDVEGSLFKGVSFLTPERAVKALARMNAYREWREK
jgi:acyl-CoA synthetase (NDP forming)